MTTPDTEREFDVLLEYLKRTRGFDFTGYKRAGLARRFEKQMQAVGVAGYADYRDYLEVHTAEFAALFNAILINVTAFFRDPAAWEYLAKEVIPQHHRRQGGERADPRLERRLRLRRGGLHAGDAAGRGAGHGAVPRARQDLRDRRGRGGAEPRPPRLLRRPRGRRHPGAAAGKVLRARQLALRLPPGPAAQRHLRAQRSRAGRPDLPRGPADLPQHPDVPQRRGAGAHPEPLPLRPQRRRLFVSGQGGDAVLPRQPVPAARPEAAPLHQGPEEQPARPPAAAGPAPQERRRHGSGAEPPAAHPRGRLRLRLGRAGRGGLRRPDQPGQRAGARPVPPQRPGPGPPLPGLGAVLPARRTALADRARPGGPPPGQPQGSPVADQRRRDALPGRAGRPPRGHAGQAAGRQHHLRRRHPLQADAGRAGDSPTGNWKRPTRSCSPPTRSWRPPTRNCSPSTRSWRPPTRSCSRPTRSWRR